jgi:hypothetical protein
MKKLVLLLVVTMVTLGANASVSESFDGGKSKKHQSGFNYKKHYRKAKRVKFFNKLFNRDNCNHYRRNGYV